MKRIIIPLLAVAAAVLACGAPTPSLPTPTTRPTASQPPSSFSFTMSVEYGILGLAQTYADAGIHYSKIQDAFVIWGNIEPSPGEYQWGPLDALVKEYQQAGFTGLQMNLTALSPWASSVPPALGVAPKEVDTFPREEYLDAYAGYVAAVAERYDRDGVDDMPGLLYPIHDYGIEREFTGYWPGTAEEYVRLLRIATPAIKAADPQGNVLLVALLMADIFDGSPSPDEIRQRVAHDADFMRKSVPEIRNILAACDAYDMVDFHALGNYTEIPLTAEWIRQELQSNGCGDKPIWIGDAFPMSGLVGYGGFVPPTPFSPVTLATRDAVVNLLKTVADPSDPEHDTDLAWLYAETAIGLTRKIVVSTAQGLRGINIGNLEDWKTGVVGVDKTTVPMLGASMFLGLTDTTITNERPGGTLPYNGKDWSKTRRAGDLRPAWYALKLVNNRLEGFTRVERMDLGTGIWAYRFSTPSGSEYVLWYDDALLHLPGEAFPSVMVSLPFEPPSATLTYTPTAIGQMETGTQNMEGMNGSLTFELGPVPVFITAAP